jgi:hypothetical protein
VFLIVTETLAGSFGRHKNSDRRQTSSRSPQQGPQRRSIE